MERAKESIPEEPVQNGSQHAAHQSGEETDRTSVEPSTKPTVETLEYSTGNAGDEDETDQVPSSVSSVTPQKKDGKVLQRTASAPSSLETPGKQTLLSQESQDELKKTMSKEGKSMTNVSYNRDSPSRPIASMQTPTPPALSEDAESQDASEGFENFMHSPPGQNAIVEQSPGGRYVRFLEKLGSGASKDVYRAYDTTEGIEVAWNVVQLSGVPKTERNRIVNEVRLLERLHHPNIISFHGSWVNRERQEVNFVTEILSSGTLTSFIEKVQVIRWKIAKRWAFQILKGLEYLHSQDPPVIHRDLKCENIFINGTSGDLRIGDLGLSTVHRNGKVLSVLGTPEFMAPDLYEESAYDEKVDIYAFGMCLLEILTKEVPYRECSNPAQIYKKVMSGEKPESLKRLRSKMARDFVNLCLGYQDEATGKYVRPNTTELLKHKFLAKSADDDSEVIVDPPLQRRTIVEDPVMRDPLAGFEAQSDGTIEDKVPLPVSRRKSEAAAEDDSDKFEEMPDSEVNIRKVKVLTGRNEELKEDEEDMHPPVQPILSDSMPLQQELPGQHQGGPLHVVDASTMNGSSSLVSSLPQQSHHQQQVLPPGQHLPPQANQQSQQVHPQKGLQHKSVLQPGQPPQHQGLQQQNLSQQHSQQPLSQQTQQHVMHQQQGFSQPPVPQGVQQPAGQQVLQHGQHFLFGAAIIEDQSDAMLHYQDDILKLIITLPVDGQTQNVQFKFHLVEDDPVEVAREMVTELGIPQEATLEISGTISALARDARIEQGKHRRQLQIQPGQGSSGATVGQESEAPPQGFPKGVPQILQQAPLNQGQVLSGSPPTQSSIPLPSLSVHPQTGVAEHGNFPEKANQTPSQTPNQTPAVSPLPHHVPRKVGVSLNSEVSDLTPHDPSAVVGENQAARMVGEGLEVSTNNDDDDLGEDEDIMSEELKRLDEDFQKNMLRAQKVFDSRMDNLQRSKLEKEMQHKKTLQKHEKERIEFEKRVQQEAKEQSRRLEKMQRDWETQRELLGKTKKKVTQTVEMGSGLRSLSTSPSQEQLAQHPINPLSAVAVAQQENQHFQKHERQRSSSTESIGN